MRPDAVPASGLPVQNPSNKKGYPVERNFSYHAPSSDQVKVYEEIRAKFKEMAATILRLVPESREQSVALTNLETAAFWANAGIAREGK